MSMIGNWWKQMNKQEAIERIKNIDTLNIKDRIADKGVAMVMKNQVLSIVSQAYAPKKPVVPEFVAEWVDDSREYRFDFDGWFDCNNQPKTVQLWLNSENKRQAELNALALVTLIVNGANAVEIKQEKLYTVEIPNPNGVVVCLERLDGGKIALSTLGESKLTESEIKKDFEWAWQWAKEVK